MSKLWDLIFFNVKLPKILHQISADFQILGYFWQNYECLFPGNQKVFKNLLLGAISDGTINWGNFGMQGALDKP